MRGLISTGALLVEIALKNLTFFAVAASAYPAWRAARLRPITAMHHVG